MITEYEVEISNSSQEKASFVAPDVDEKTELIFRLSVKDDDGNTDSDECSITIVPKGSLEGNDNTGGTDDPKDTDGSDPVITDDTTGGTLLWFPHLKTNDDWDSEIGILNTDAEASMEGSLIVYDENGYALDSLSVDLPAMGRKQVILKTQFENPEKITYAIFSFTSGVGDGYARVFIENLYRASYPAVTEVNSGTIYLPHIAADGSSWDTTITLLNTVESQKSLKIVFNTGDTKTVSLDSMQHKSFTMNDLFNGGVPAGLRNGYIESGSDIVGVEVFEWGNMLAATLLKDDLDDHLYFPHVPDDDYWSTGIALYNPSGYPAVASMLPYDADGNLLDPLIFKIEPWDSLVGLVGTLGFPEETAWLDVISTQPLSAIDMFQTDDFNNYAGFSAVGMKSKKGFFPKIDGYGTGIAFVNLGYSTASVTLTAYSDSGTSVAEKVITVTGHEKTVGIAQELFDTDISGATYIGFTSDQYISVFSGNQSSDRMMYDAIPAL